MIRRTVILVVAFAILHLAGAREAVGFLSGTVPEGHGVPLFGALYLLAWFGFVLVAPILVIAATIERAYLSIKRTAVRTSSTE